MTVLLLSRGILRWISPEEFSSSSPTELNARDTHWPRVRRCLSEILRGRRKIDKDCPEKIVRRFRCSSVELSEIELFDEIRVERMITCTLIKSLQSESIHLRGCGCGCALAQDLCEWTGDDGWFVVRDDLFDVRSALEGFPRNERSSNRAEEGNRDCLSLLVDMICTSSSSTVLPWDNES